MTTGRPNRLAGHTLCYAPSLQPRLSRGELALNQARLPDRPPLADLPGYEERDEDGRKRKRRLSGSLLALVVVPLAVAFLGTGATVGAAIIQVSNPPPAATQEHVDCVDLRNKVVEQAEGHPELTEPYTDADAMRCHLNETRDQVLKSRQAALSPPPPKPGP